MSTLKTAPARLAALLRGTVADAWAQTGRGRPITTEMELWAREDGRAPFLGWEGRSRSIAEVNGRANGHAAAFAALGLEVGSAVALLHPQHPEALMAFWGAVKAGLVPALFDARLEGPQLARAIGRVAPAAVIVAGCRTMPELSVPTFAQELEGGAERGLPRWDPPDAAPDPETIAVDPTSAMAYVFTSGTTSVPKPAVIRHQRFSRSGAVMGAFLRVGADDVLYAQQPLARANVLVLAASVALRRRAQLAIGKPDPARYWEEAATAGATIGLYGGRLAAELIHQSPSVADRAHGIRRMVGDGLSAAHWETFRRRFGVDEIFELYGCTEGNAHSVNLLNTEGSCGLLIPGLALARWDPESEDVVRNDRGFAEMARPKEPGLILGVITDRNDFAGYKSEAMTSRKILRDVFRPGDCWFDGGDLLWRDRFKRLYYQERLGETFVSDGERLSTYTVVEALRDLPEIERRTVFTVSVPGGRAVVAAVTVRAQFDGARMFSALSERLEPAAVPEWLRVVPADRLKRSELKARGLEGREGLFRRDRARGAYVAVE